MTPAPSTTEATKTCPTCGQDIRADARVCWCGHEFWAPTVTTITTAAQNCPNCRRAVSLTQAVCRCGHQLAPAAPDPTSLGLDDSTPSNAAAPHGVSPPAAWYASPTGPGQRYWDGSKWTDSYARPEEPTSAPMWPPNPCAPPNVPAVSTPSAATQFPFRISGSLTTISFVLAVLSLGVLPIVIGPAAIICAGVGMNRKEPNAPIALAVAIVAMIVGMFLGAVVGAQNSG